ncbi:PE family protein [Minicystis rosea]|nr:PE family protein [Minicystis rosea]
MPAHTHPALMTEGDEEPMPLVRSGKSFYQRSRTKPGASEKTDTIYSTLPELVLTQSAGGTDPDAYCLLDRERDVEIFAEAVTIRGPLVIPGRSVTIVARVIDAKPNAFKEPACIDVSGNPGKELLTPTRTGAPLDADNGVDAYIGYFWQGDTLATPGKDGREGARGDSGLAGEPGGTVRIFAGRITGPLDVRAGGGKGGRGQRGQRGGKGGDGGRGYAWHYPPAYGQSDWYKTLSPAEGGAGGRGGEGGRGGDGGKGGTARVLTLDAPGAEVHASASGGAGGNGGEGGEGGTAGTRFALVTFGLGAVLPADKQVSEYTSPVRTPGRDGQSGNAGPAGAAGVEKGSLRDIFDACKAHYPYLAMLVQRARDIFVSEGVGAAADPRLGEIFDWLYDLLAPASDRDEDLYALFTEAAILRGRLRSEQDAFGHQRNYAPSPSFQYIQRAIKDSIDALESVEKSYESYTALLEQQHEELSDLGALESNVRTARQLGEGDIKSAKERIEQMALEMRAARVACEDARRDVVRHLGELEASIYRKFNMDFRTIASALEMLTFVPPSHGYAGAAMMGLQTTKLLYEGWTTIKGSDGVTIDKSDLVTRIYRVQGKGFEALRAALADTGDIRDVGKVFANLDEYTEIVDSFCDVDGAPAMRSALRRLTDAFQEHSLLQLRYTVEVSALRESLARLAELDGQFTARLRAVRSASDPSLPAVAAFFSRLHQRMRDRLIERISMSNRAYAYWSLDTEYNVFRAVLEDRRAWDPDNVAANIDASVLRACQDALQTQYTNVLARYSHAPQKFPADDDAPGLSIRVDDPESLLSLKTTGKVQFRIGWLEGRPGVLAAPMWRDWADVRLSRVSVYLHGATVKSDDDLVIVRIVHDRDDTFIPVDARHPKRPSDPGKSIVFWRDAVEAVEFSYWPRRNNKRFAAGEYALTDVHAETAKAIYAGVGPYTGFTLEIDSARQPGVDLSGVHTIEVQFHGYFRTLRIITASAKNPESSPSIRDREVKCV